MSGLQVFFNFKKEEKELLEKELVEFQNCNNEIANEFSEIRKKRADLLEKNIKLSKENSNLKKDIFELQKMNEKIKEALKLFENFEKYQKGSKEKCEGLVEALSNLMSICKGEQSKELPSLEKLEECEAERKEWADKLTDIENIIAEGEKSNNEEIPKKEAEIQEISNKIKEFIQRKAEAENETMQLSGYCEDMKKTAETKSKEILELQNYKTELQSRVAELKIPSNQNSDHEKEI